MDFNDLKKKALELKDKANEQKDKLIASSADKISKSGAVIRDTKDNKKEEILKEFKEKNKKSAIIFAEDTEAFFKKALYMFPVLFTKGWTQNYALKIFPVKEISEIDSFLNIEKLPTLVVYKNNEEYERYTNEEELMKVVKDLNLDIENVKK
jgi:hypothetical protein